MMYKITALVVMLAMVLSVLSGNVSLLIWQSSFLIWIRLAYLNNELAKLYEEKCDLISKIEFKKRYEDKKQAVLIVNDESGAPTAAVLFEGRDHTFYTLEKMGMDEVHNLLNKNLIDKKIEANE